DVLAAALEPSCEVTHELDVCVHLRGGPPVHRDIVDGRGRAPVVLEQQVLGHGGSPCVSAAPVGPCAPGTEQAPNSRHRRRPFLATYARTSVGDLGYCGTRAETIRTITSQGSAASGERRRCDAT